MGYRWFRWAFVCLVLGFASKVHAGEVVHDPHWNHLSVLGGVTVIDEEVDPIVGLEYERLGDLVNGKIGVMATFEIGFRHHTAYALGLGVAVHPWKGLKIAALPIIEFEDGHQGVLARIGLGYDVHIGQISIGPFVAIDGGGHHIVQLYTLAAGYSF